MRDRKLAILVALSHLLLLPPLLSCCSNAAEQRLAPVTIEPPLLNTKRLTLEQAVTEAGTNYPQIVMRLEQIEAAKSAVTLQKLREYMPQGLSTWENVVATHNKLTQILFGNPVLVANPGPGLDPEHQTMHPTFYNGSGFLFDWTPLDFGLHRAHILEAKAGLAQARANYSVTRLDVVENAALAFLAQVMSQEQVRAQEANVARMNTMLEVVRGLVLSGLRPGVDLSIAEAQLAEARNGLIQAQQELKMADARLAASIGEPGLNIDVDPEPVEKETRPVLKVSLNAFDNHPLVLAQRSVINVLLAHNQVISKSSYPVIHWLAGMNFRGSGLDIHGQRQEKDAFGWLPTVTNWNIGVMANWNFLDWITNNQELRMQRHRIAAEQATYRQIIQNLTEQTREAAAMVEGAVALAENTAVQLRAASEAELRARTRYSTGLASIAEVAQAEQLLTRAQVQMAVARVGVWRALLAVSHAKGDIAPFLQEVAVARQQGM